MNTVISPPPLPHKRGPIVRFFIGLWDAMNFTRRLILNLLFFFILFVVGIAMLSALTLGSKSSVRVQDRTTLVLELQGRLVEQDSRDALTRALESQSNNATGQVQLRDVLAVINAAAADKKIERVLLDVDALSFGGHAAAYEVAAALRKLRESGKQIVVASRGMSQSQYLLAAQANEIYLDPDGQGVMLEGLSAYRPYFREALQDKLGVDFHLFKVGEYKSAAEPFVRDSASPEAKEADLHWMGDIWNKYLTEVAARRGIAAQDISQSIDNMAAGIEAAQGDLNRYALEQKLIDGLMTRDQVDALLVERGVEDKEAEGGFRQVDFEQYLAHIQPALPAEADSRPQVAVVVAEGEIVPGQQPRGVVGGETVAALLRQAREDAKIKAVVLRVNSPGGEVFASELMRREVVALKQAGKPVVVSMGDVAASGGYWISMNADRIYAEPTTITGSIGIFGLVPNLSRAMDKLGIHSDGVGTTRFAGGFDLTRPLDPDMGRVIQSVINRGYRDFTGKVAEARGKPLEAIEAAAQGRVWSGTQAKSLGLVDEFGGLQAAIEDAAKRGKMEKGKYLVRYVEDTGNPLQSFLGNWVQSRSGLAVLRESAWVREILGRANPKLQEPLRYLESQVQQPNGGMVRPAAHCFCMPDRL